MAWITDLPINYSLCFGVLGVFIGWPWTHYKELKILRLEVRKGKTFFFV
jgi:hypothetical protein